MSPVAARRTSNTRPAVAVAAATVTTKSPDREKANCSIGAVDRIGLKAEEGAAPEYKSTISNEDPVRLKLLVPTRVQFRRGSSGVHKFEKVRGSEIKRLSPCNSF